MVDVNILVKTGALFALAIPAVLGGCAASSEDPEAEGSAVQAEEVSSKGPSVAPVAPTTVPPKYVAPVYTAPVYTAPRYAAPVYTAPVYQPPVYVAPIYQTPVYQAPVYPASDGKAPMYMVPISAMSAGRSSPQTVTLMVGPYLVTLQISSASS